MSPSTSAHRRSTSRSTARDGCTSPARANPWTSTSHTPRTSLSRSSLSSSPALPASRLKSRPWLGVAELAAAPASPARAAVPASPQSAEPPQRPTLPPPPRSGTTRRRPHPRRATATRRRRPLPGARGSRHDEAPEVGTTRAPQTAPVVCAPVDGSRTRRRGKHQWLPVPRRPARLAGAFFALGNTPVPPWLRDHPPARATPVSPSRALRPPDPDAALATHPCCQRPPGTGSLPPRPFGRGSALTCRRPGPAAQPSPATKARTASATS